MMSGGKSASAELALAKKLQLARKAAGLTQEQLCQKAGLSLSTLTKIERGAIRSPSIFTIQGIAGAVNTSLDELMDAAGPRQVTGSASPDISFVYFDVNGCLVHFFQNAFTKIAKDTGQSLEKVETAYWHYNDEACRGSISVDEFNALFAERLGVSSLDWVSYYLDVLEPVTEAHELIRWVAEKYKVGLLTNIMPGLLNKLRHHKLVPDIKYDVVVDSSEVGAVKPETEIYELALERAGVPASEVLFVDDSRVNLTAAERLGWRVMWFDDYHGEESANRVRTALELPASR